MESATLLTRIIAIGMISTVLSCSTKTEKQADTASPQAKASIRTTSFGALSDGTEVTLYTLKNSQGVEMSVINYGGIIVSLKVPDKNGRFEDVVLGFDSLSWYEKNNPYFGSLIGRYGNRIAGGKFTLDKKEYVLPVNNGPNHLHGGPGGFDNVFWNIEIESDSSLRLTYTSVDGEQGYPGTLSAEVLYSLTNNNEISIHYKATTDKKTIVNLTQHSYFNLTGNPANDILGHTLQINADYYLPVDKTLIPTGVVQTVENTVFDFTKLTSIGSRISENDEQLLYGGGYDHCWVFNNDDSEGDLRSVATLIEPNSGRKMEVLTTEPGIQFYSGNFLDGTLTGKNGIVYGYRSGLCLETQHYPDSPNKPEFPSVVLNPGETYNTTTVYRFSVIE